MDSEIEIFDGSGSATGAIFLVQLKGTDEPDLQKALRLWFPKSKHDYYRSLDLPVLIVRYHSPSKRLFVRWFHDLKASQIRRSRKGVNFRLTEQNVWDDSVPDRIANEVEAYRRVKSPRLIIPLCFSLLIEEKKVHGIPAYQLRLNFQQAARQVQHLIEFQTKSATSAAAPHLISINNKEIRIKLGGIHGFALHTPHGNLPGHGDTLHYDVLLGLGLALDRLGHVVEAAHIISNFWRESPLSRQIVFAISMAFCLARANQMHQAMQIAETFFTDDSTVYVAQIFLLPFFARQVGLLSAERDFGVRFTSRIACDLERKGNNSLASTLNYNCANLLREMSRFMEAIRHYRKAARLDASYLERPYYWRELAGILFLSERYAIAARFYRRSLDLKDHRLTNLLYADALMFSGQYRVAEEIFDRLVESPAHPDDAEWALKKFALSIVRDVTRLDEQRRKTPKFPHSFNPRELEEAEVERVCMKALEEDALSALAWFNLGGVQLRAGDNEHAASCFLLAALIVPSDLESWANVIALAKNADNLNLLGHALVAAYQLNGEKLLNEIADRMPEKHDELLELFEKILHYIPSRSNPSIMRTHESNSDWNEFEINSDGSLQTRDMTE